MKSKSSLIYVVVLAVIQFLIPSVHASEADNTTITVTAQNAGPTPFINQLSLLASDTSVIKSVQFSIAPRPSSVTRPLSATYTNNYLIAHGDLDSGTGQIFLPVYGLYAGYNNTVTLTYHFTDGSSKQAQVAIVTSAFNDPCGYNSPTILQKRTATTSLSYDYLMIKEMCDTFSPAIIDTDGILRWVGTTGLSSFTEAFVDNAAFMAHGTSLYRNDLDGTFSLIGDYASLGISDFHHNIDRGKFGVLLEADTPTQVESTIFEVNISTGAVLKTFSMSDIISSAMIAGGDDPSQFVYPAPDDWFHNNAVTYNRADDSLIVSSRENFLICIDYETSKIKWILGDTTKKWHQFPSLARYALSLAPGSLPPIGQHGVSITYDQGVMVFDNGQMSSFQMPPGAERRFASPRKYTINLTTNVATEVWNYPQNESVLSPFCGSVYEDAPLNYLVDYAFVNGTLPPPQYGQLLGLDAAGERVFYYQYPTTACSTAFNSVPLHLENTRFPAFGPKVNNLSTRGVVSNTDDTLIAGFIVSGTETKTVVLRALGPSLTDVGVSGAVSDPDITLYDKDGKIVGQNDNWQTDPGAGFIVANGLAPTNPAESALLENLSPGSYTAVVRSQDGSSGIGLVEAYDVSPTTNSTLANVSTRGVVGTNSEALIGGFIVGDVGNATVIVRALGPSLAADGIANPVSDPALTVYDNNGNPIASNDNWQDGVDAFYLKADNLAPTNDAEAALILHPPAGAYTTIVTGNSGSGIGLLEVYDLN